MRYVFTLFLLISFNACTVTTPHMVEYRLQTQPATISFESASCKEKSLKVSQVFSQNTLMTQKMKYVQDGFQEYAFSESEWSQSPNKSLTQEILQSVRATKLFKNVQGYKSRSKSDYLLESSIEEFMQHFSHDAKSSYVDIAIAFTLVDMKSSEVVDSITIRKRVPVNELSAQGGVKAFNEGLNELLMEKNSWLNEVCK